MKIVVSITPTTAPSERFGAAGSNQIAGLAPRDTRTRGREPRDHICEEWEQGSWAIDDDHTRRDIDSHSCVSDVHGCPSSLKNMDEAASHDDRGTLVVVLNMG